MNKKMFIVALMLLMMITPVASIMAQVTEPVYVDQAYLDGGSDGSSGKPWPTIWEAIVEIAAFPDSTNAIIIVSEGLYAEAIDIVPALVGLELKAADGKDVTIQGVSSDVHPFATVNLIVNADDVTIHGFTLLSTQVTSEKPYSTNIVVYGTNAEIYDNDFVFTNDLVFSARLDGMTTGAGWFEGVKPSEAFGDGFGAGLNVHDNTFTATDPDPTNGDTGTGIFISSGGAGTVTITDNVFTGLVRAIGVWDQVGVSITGNTFEDSVDLGVEVWMDKLTSLDIVINYNDILAAIGVINAEAPYSAPTVDATFNWWGRPDIVGIITGTSGNIDADPWLDDEYHVGTPVTTTGATGVKGDTGSRGSTGAKGSDGRDGSRGSSGSDGRDGSKGSSGSDGLPGIPGDDGVNGFDGSDGVDGKDGSDGLQGPVGESGDQGSPGAQGQAGPQGNVGDTGPPGPMTLIMISAVIGTLGLILGALAFFRKP